jgi:hypothetical protein
MGWIDWVRRALGGVFNRIEDLANSVTSALGSLFHIIRILGTNVSRHWGSLRYHLTRGPSTVLSFIGHSLNLAHWFATVFVPRWAHWAKNEVLKWAIRQIDTLTALVWRLYNFLLKGIDTAVNKLRVWALDWINNLRRRLDDAWAFLTRIGALVLNFLTDPIRLVTWILPVLVGPLFRFIDSRREAIARWLLDQMLRTILAQAPRIEALITRIF